MLKKREGGFVNIIAKKENKGCLITIEDNGIGIDQKIIDNLDDRIDKNIGLKNVLIELN